MHYIKIFLFLTLLTTNAVMAVQVVSDNKVPTLTTEFGKTGTIDGVDPEGKWIQINNKKYILNTAGSVAPEFLRLGSRIFFNVEKEKGERNGRVTRIWKGTGAK